MSVTTHAYIHIREVAFVKKFAILLNIELIFERFSLRRLP